MGTITALRSRNTPPDRVLIVARAMVAHMLTETGRAAEFNYNVANLHPSASWNGPVYILPGTDASQRAYTSVNAGTSDYVATMARAYLRPLLSLAGGTIDEGEWYSEVRASGWSANPATGTELAEFQTALARLIREFPAIPPDPPPSREWIWFGVFLVTAYLLWEKG